MLSKKLITIFGFSIPLFIAHGIEEIQTGFYNVDVWDRALFVPFEGLSMHSVMFVTFQMMLWVLLCIVLAMLINEKTRLYTLALAGGIYVLELHHIYKALAGGGYYPGLITSLLFPFVAVIFWKEWMKNYRNINQL
ncbi:MAG: hypothetical protein A3E36_02725 [Candidatus Andersenbacteria bacterium RIFCSPHIGHO2_12_FULL_45_11b]|uniref:HXXEE domain-containing protein n=1 Tax=Candidatus Andersenbacteria bacterium RIFCSPHIGHO2_12_FULL_45_11b TaxID=1797282 RepID=A0A1G1XC04_9BACT|nr:MAG: hypothetical protein A3E36_02725 [Candidatus Andersenbacteria bacterium RIFCSPHIGHO2_12_FULL_45_11b]